MPERVLNVTIVDDTTSPRTCTGDCGTDWSKVEVLEAARKQIMERFGGRAVLDYIDLPHAPDTPKTRKTRIAVKGIPLPVLLADERPRVAGEFDVGRIMDVIEVDLEAEL